MFGLLLRYMLLLIQILSGATLLGALSYVALRILRKPEARIASTITILTGMVEAAGGLWLGLSGAQVTLPDEGQKAVESFYNNLGEKDFPEAWRLIHSARKSELASRGLKTDKDFGSLYQTTQEYRNVRVRLDQVQSADSRLYWVTFDVRDKIPANTFYQKRSVPLDEMIGAGLVRRDTVFTAILQDLRRNYEVPTATVPAIQQLALTQRDLLCDPLAISNLARNNKLPRVFPGFEVDVWFHYIQHLKVEKDYTTGPDGSKQAEWKIRSGLYPSTFVGPYAAGEIPNVAPRD